jgi:two-component system LytT family response regulator
MIIRAMIVDDEPLARRRLRSLIATDPELQLVEEAGDGASAVAGITTLKPDLLFLDVQMPGMDGFEVLREASTQHVPIVIFVTAFDRYAVSAFDAHAIDYLLKPFKRTRFFEAVQRAKQALSTRTEEPEDKLISVLNQLQRDTSRLAVKSGGRIVFLREEEIDWIEAAANYVRIHGSGREYLVRDTLNSFAERMSSRRFLRIHRSIIVNVDRISELEPCNGSEYIILLRDGKELPVGRSYRESVESALQVGNTVAGAGRSKSPRFHSSSS